MPPGITVKAEIKFNAHNRRHCLKRKFEVVLKSQKLLSIGFFFQPGHLTFGKIADGNLPVQPHLLIECKSELLLDERISFDAGKNKMDMASPLKLVVRIVDKFILRLPSVIDQQFT